VSSVSPATGSTAGGAAVTVSGTGFTAGATVTFGGVSATNISVNSGTSISARTPAHAAGAVDVVVTNTDGQSGTLSAGFTYTNPPPTLTAISPGSGTTNGGTSVTLTGSGFLPGASVTFGGTLATNVILNNNASITCRTPSHPAGVVSVTVINSDGQSATLTNVFTYSTAPAETVLLADDFGSTQIDLTRWSTNLFSGFTDSAVPMALRNQQLQIGPLDLNTAGSHYNGLRSAAAFNFTGAYCYVEIMGAPASNTAGDAMLTVGTDVNNYYRLYIEAGNLICQRKAAGVKATLLTQVYNAANARFLRIRHDAAAAAVIFEIAPDNAGPPGNWIAIFSEAWNSAIPLTGMILEIKAGTWQSEPNAPGTVVFDNFRAAVPQ